jgi:hypothetical protein
MAFKITVEKDKVVPFVKKNGPKSTKDFTDYGYFGAQIAINAQDLYRNIERIEGPGEILSYLKSVVSASSQVGKSFGDIYVKVAGGLGVRDEDIQKHYLSLANLATLFVSGSSLAEKYKGKLSKDVEEDFTWIMIFMEKELKHANKIFG